MIGIERFTEVVLSFQQVEEKAHFEKTSFRIKNKIFATLNESNHQVVIKLSEIDQSIFCDIDEKIIRPVPGSWGKKDGH